MSPSFARERFISMREEILALIPQHYAEVEHFQDIPLDPDFDMYARADEGGPLRVFTVRHLGALIGYAFFSVFRAPHSRQSMWAQADVVFVVKEHRGGFGADFIAWCDQQLRAEGVQVVTHHVKAAHNWGRLLERQGYELVDLVFQRRLDR